MARAGAPRAGRAASALRRRVVLEAMLLVSSTESSVVLRAGGGARGCGGRRRSGPSLRYARRCLVSLSSLFVVSCVAPPCQRTYNVRMERRRGVGLILYRPGLEIVRPTCGRLMWMVDTHVAKPRAWWTHICSTADAAIVSAVEFRA